MDAELAGYVTPVRSAAVSATRLVWRRRVAKAARWLHIYGSMLCLALVLFFAITGITLNHQDWFAGSEATSERQGTVDPAWLTGDAAAIDRLRVVEYLRANSGIRGAVSDFRAGDREVEVIFKGPGYSANVTIDRPTGQFDLSETRLGLAAVINDLHKGRDSGRAWSVVIDASAAVLVFISLTGLILLYFVHKYRVAGAILGVAGALAGYLVYAAFVP